LATGVVARFDVRRGYGFVIPDDGGEDVFVHQNNILMEGFRFLNAGEHVSYELEVGEKGMKAVQVALLDPRPPEPPRQQRDYDDYGSNGHRGDRHDRHDRHDRSDRHDRGPRSRGGDDRSAQKLEKAERKLERLISLLVDKGVMSPGEIDGIIDEAPVASYDQID
jgi:cold shock CspA family protein